MSVNLTNKSDSRSLQRRVFNLAWPVISENFLQTLLGIVDTFLVAKLGAEALAGVGAAIQLMFFVISALSALSVGSAVLVAQAVGARAFDRANQIAKQSLVWSFLLSIPIVLIGLLAADTVVGIFGMDPAVNAIGADYLRVTMGAVVVLTLMLIGGGVLRGAGDSRTPMLVTAFANVLNAILVYGLIFGKWGMPELGAVGSAWGTLLSRMAGCVLLFWVMWRGSNGVHIRGREGWAPAWLTARQILTIGVPAALEQVLMTTGFLVLTVVVAQLGTVAMAAHRVSMNAMSLAFLPGLGFGLAATALVGQSIGAGRPEEGVAAGRIATVWAFVWMSSFGLIFLFFGKLILRLFTEDVAVVEMGATGMLPLALAQPFWAISIVQASGLRGTGETRYQLWVNTIGIWVAVILGASFVHFISPTLAAAWTSFLFTAPVTAFLFWKRFQQIAHKPIGTVGQTPIHLPAEL